MVNKPAGMMVHAGSGQNEDARNRGTLVNALLYRFKKLSATGGDLRPGIVHRLDKETSGLIVVAKNDRTHAALAEMFSSRQIKKTYIALVQGAVERAKGTINASVGRDPMRRTRMTAKPLGDARTAVSHYEVVQRLENRFGKFTLVKVRIETGPDASDSCAYGVDWPPGGGRHALWRFGAVDRPGGLAGRDLESGAAQGGAGEAQAGAELSACRAARVSASEDGEGAGAGGAAARGAGGVSGADGRPAGYAGEAGGAALSLGPEELAVEVRGFPGPQRRGTWGTQL